MIPTLKLEFMPGAGPFDVAGDHYLLSTGATGSNATTPDAAALDIVGDIDVRVDMTLDRWVAPAGTAYEVFGKFAPAANQSWLLSLDENRKVTFRWSADGTATIVIRSTSPIPITSGRLAIRATLDVDNGAAGNTVTFYTAPNISGSWTPLGTAVVTAGTTSIFNSTATLGVGNVPTSGFASPAGRFHAARVYADLVGTDVRANPDFTAQAPGTTSFADGAGRTWTVNSPASIAGFNWVDITADLLATDWDEGRTDDLTRFGPGAQSVVLRNDDRRYDPKHAAGTYFGKLNPRTPFRFRKSSDGGSSWHDRFYGFARGGFRQTFYPPAWATCTVPLEDMLAVIANTRLPGSAYEAEVLADVPAADWKLDETTGTQMADSSGNGRHGFYDNSVLGQDPLTIGGGRSVEFPHVGDHRGRWQGGGLPVAAPCSLEAWVRTTRDAAAIKSIIVAQRDASLGQALWLQIDTAAGGSPNGELVINFFALGTNYKARGHTRIDDDRPHHVVCTIAGNTAADVLLYVDGVLQTKTTVAGTNPGSWPSLLLWTVGNTTDTGFGDFGFDGRVDDVAIYDYVLDPTRVTSHYQAGATAFANEATGARIGRVLDLVGLPASMRDIATGDTTLGPASYAGSQVGAYLARVVESEQGYLYVNHRNAGKVTFQGRYHRLTSSRSTTSQATFTDVRPTPGGQYEFKEVHPAPNAIDSIVNEVEITWRGGTEIVSDDTSIDAYGPQGRTLATEAPTPEAARSAGQWMITRYGQPQARVRGLVLNPGGDSAVWPAVLTLRVGDRITVTYTPQGVGSAISEQLIVEGIHNSMRDGVGWEMSYSLSDADDTQVWIWGTGQWGTTTVWG